MLERRWGLNGMHYSRTLEAWLARQDAHRSAVLPLMEVGKKASADCRACIAFSAFLTSPWLLPER